MKTLIAIPLLVFCLLIEVFGTESVTLAWDPSTDPEVTGAIVYWGNASRNYPWHTNVGNVVRATVQGLTNGLTYYFAVTATNTAGLESDYSNEVSCSIPERPPPYQNLTITSTFQASKDLSGPWTNLLQMIMPVEAKDEQVFYRTKVDIK